MSWWETRPGGLLGSRFPTTLLEISGFICPCVTGDITANTLSGLFPYFMLSQELQLCVFTGPSLCDCLFGSLLDHLVQFIRLISSCKVPLPGFLLRFTRFKVRASSAELPLECFATIIAWSGALTGDTSILLCSLPVNLEEDCVLEDEWHRKGERGSEISLH